MSSITARTFNNVDNHAINLYRYVSDLFDVNNVNNKFADVHLKFGSKTFYCHKFVLSLSSKYFANIYFSSKIRVLQGINPDHFYDILQFMYTGEIIVTTNNIVSLLSAACVLGIDALNKACSQFFDDVLNADNALLYWRLANKYRLTKFAEKCQAQVINSFGISEFYLRNTSSQIMKLILNNVNLDVKSEEAVCDMLMKWLQVRVEAGHEVHPDQLLPLIRWSGINVNYVKSKLLQNTTLTSNPSSISFLSKVITYLLSGIQFDRLQTFHRPSTGFENCLMTLGLNHGLSRSNKVFRISLQHPSRVTELTTTIQTKMSGSTSALLLNNHVYVTGVLEIPYKETWCWNVGAKSEWIQCADMLTGRVYHCVAVADSMLYVLGGWIETDKTMLTSVECYNTKTYKWSSAGHLNHAVKHAACVTYKNSIYVFGGADKDEAVACVQVYNPAKESCTLMDKPMPCAYSHMRAVLWETSAILLGRFACFIYNFETQAWQERKQFKTAVSYFAIALDNSTVYIAGGATGKRENNKVIWTCTDEIKSVPVSDIIQNKSTVWKLHAQLPKPAMIPLFVNTFLSL